MLLNVNRPCIRFSIDETRLSILSMDSQLMFRLQHWQDSGHDAQNRHLKLQVAVVKR